MKGFQQTVGLFPLPGQGYNPSFIAGGKLLPAVDTLVLTDKLGDFLLNKILVIEKFAK